MSGTSGDAGDTGNRRSRWAGSALSSVVPVTSVSVQVDQKEPEDAYKEENTAGKEKKSNRRRLLCELLLDFAKNTTLHGLRYITERRLSLSEKIFWIVSFLLSVILCTILTHNVWVKWKTNKVIATFSERHSYVSEVPFPAVTFCPHAKIDQRVYNYTKAFNEVYDFYYNDYYGESRNTSIKFTESYILDFARTRLVCNDFFGTAAVKYLLNRSIDDHAAVQKIIEVAPKRDDIFLIVRWHAPFSVFWSPFNFINQVLTEEGVCYTFNSLASDEILNKDRIQGNYSYLDADSRRNGWSPESGYLGSSDDTYPRRGRANSGGPLFSLSMQDLMTRDEACDGNQRGFKIYLHHPGDLPQTSMYYYTAVPGQDNSFAISVDVQKSSDSLFHCPLNSRQCYFTGERSLKYFKIYSQSNCRLECIANFTLARCGCVLFHMPHEDSTVICSFVAKYFCLKHNLEKYVSEEGITSGNTSQCKCLPTCNNVEYQAEVFKTNTKYRRSGNNTMIEMFFKKPVFVSRVRECTGMFELTDFLAYCGGLLGLFLGFSFLSLVEILYFCTLRFGCMFTGFNQTERKENINHVKNI